MVKIMAKIAFGGGDPDLAAADLERAGYKVNRMPDEYRTRMQDADEHLEAIIEARNDDDDTVIAISDHAGNIADEYGGMCVECGVLDPGEEPFDYLFPDSPGTLRFQQRH